MSLAATGTYAYVATFALPAAANASLVLLAVVSVLVAALDRRRSPRDNRLLAAVVFFGLSTIISVSTSVDVARSLRLSVPLIPGALLFLLISGSFGRREIRGLYATFSLVSLAAAGHLLWVAQPSWGNPVGWMERTDTTLFVVPNDVAFFATVLPLSLALVADAPGIALGALGTASVLADVTVVVMYQSRGALLTTLLVIGLWATHLRWRTAVALMGAAVVVILGIDGTAGFPLCRRFWETWGTRVPIWLAALHMFRDAPLLGHGPRCFALLFNEYFGHLVLPAWLPADPRFAPWAHNLYLETLAEQGLVGFGALSLLLGRAFSTAIRLQRAHLAETRTLARGALVGLGGLCAAGLFELSFLRLWVVVVFFSLMGVIAALAVTVDGSVVVAADDSCPRVEPQGDDRRTSGVHAVARLLASLAR